MRGRKPKPTVLKLLQGNPGKRPINRDEPPAAPLDPALPAELADAELDAQEEWRRTIAPAIDVGQITSRDRALAIAHCILWATWRSQLAEAAKHAHIVSSGRNGHPIPNPARRMANQSLMLLTKIAAELGLTPVSRSRVHAVSGAAEDDEQEKLARLLAIR